MAENQNPLIQAPARLSDLHGDELRQALFARHENAKRVWLQARRPRPLLARLFGRAA